MVCGPVTRHCVLAARAIGRRTCERIGLADFFFVRDRLGAAVEEGTEALFGGFLTTACLFGLLILMGCDAHDFAELPHKK